MKVVPILFVCLLLASCSSDVRKVKVTELDCYPPEIKLDSAKARQGIVVEAIYADGVTLDVTGLSATCLIRDTFLRLYRRCL